MRAVVYRGSGGRDVIAIEEVREPRPGTDEALVAVAFAGINRADILERMGRYPAARADKPIPGLEFSGIVRELGSAGGPIAVGDRVCGLVTGGAQAEFVSANVATLVRVPQGVSLRDAAALPEAYQTAYDALFARARFAMGESVLIHAVGGAVGLAAVALAKRAGGFTIGTSRTPAKLERAKGCGLDVAIAYDDHWSAAVRTATQGRGVDCILDFIGAAAFEANLAVLATGGRIVHIGTLGGVQAPFSIATLMVKRATLVGTMLRTRPLDEKVALTRDFARLMPAFARGELRAVVDRVVTLAEVAEAHRATEASENFGKIVLAVDPSLE